MLSSSSSSPTHHSSAYGDIESGASLLLLSQDGWALRGGGKNNGSILYLRASTLDICGKICINIEDAAGARCDEGILTVFYWPHTTAARTTRSRREAVIEHAGGSNCGAASAWSSVLARWARCMPLTPVTPPSSKQLTSGAGSAGYYTGSLAASLPLSLLPTRRMRVFVNPNAGSGGGERAWERASPMFVDASIEVEVIVTRSAGEARANVAATNPTILRSLEGVIVVGGDGSLAEVVDGFMSRRDWGQYTRSLAIGVLPAGSGNGLAVSLCASAGFPYSADNATWAIIKGSSDPIDIASAFCAGEEEGCDSLVSGSAISLPVEASPTCESSNAFFSCESMSAGRESSSGWLVGAAKNTSAMASPVSSPIVSSAGGGGGGVAGIGDADFGGGGGEVTAEVDGGDCTRAGRMPIGRAWGKRRWSFFHLNGLYLLT